jgi:hypothetical protein
MPEEDDEAEENTAADLAKLKVRSIAVGASQGLAAS